MNPAVAQAALDVAKIGLAAVIQVILGNQKASAIVSKMQAEGRAVPSPEEEAELAAESSAIHQAHLDEIARAKAEGR